MFCFSLVSSRADGGAYPIPGGCRDRFHVTVFTLPTILSAGPVDVTVLIQDRVKLGPLLDARVTLDLSAQSVNSSKKEAWLPPAWP